MKIYVSETFAVASWVCYISFYEFNEFHWHLPPLINIPLSFMWQSWTGSSVSSCHLLAVVENTYLHLQFSSVQFSSVHSLSCVQLFVTPWIAARQASLFITISRSSLRLTSIKSVMPSSHLILGRPLLLLPPIPPSIRVFSNESTLCMRWPKYWSFSFSIIPSKQILVFGKWLCWWMLWN